MQSEPPPSPWKWCSPHASTMALGIYLTEPIEIKPSSYEQHPASVAIAGQCPFLDVAREMRDLIYDACFDETISRTITIGVKQEPSENGIAKWIESPSLRRAPPLLLVSRQIHAEAKSRHLARIEFKIEISDSLSSPVPSFSHPSWQHMRYAQTVSLRIQPDDGGHRRAPRFMKREHEEQLARLQSNVNFAVEVLSKYQVRRIGKLQLDLRYFRPEDLGGYPYFRQEIIGDPLDVTALIATLHKLDCKPGIVVAVTTRPDVGDAIAGSGLIKELAEFEKFRGLVEALKGSLAEDHYRRPPRCHWLGRDMPSQELSPVASFPKASEKDRAFHGNRISVSPMVADRYSSRSSFTACDLLGYRTRNSSTLASSSVVLQQNEESGGL